MSSKLSMIFNLSAFVGECAVILAEHTFHSTANEISSSPINVFLFMIEFSFLVEEYLLLAKCNRMLTHTHHRYIILD